MTRQDALLLLGQIERSEQARGPRLHQIACGEWVIILNRPRAFHLWSAADWEKIKSDYKPIEGLMLLQTYRLS